MAKRIRKQILGLAKYNKILKLLRGKGKVDLKKFRELQKKASSLYPSFSGVPISKITKAKVKKAKVVSKTTKDVSKKTKETLPTISDIYKLSQTDKKLEPLFEPCMFWEVGDYRLQPFGELFPYIPMRVVWGDKNDPKTNINGQDFKGSSATYQGSDFAMLVEDMRIYYEIDLGLSSSEFPEFYIKPATYKGTDKDGKKYGLLFIIAVGEFGVIQNAKDWKKFVKTATIPSIVPKKIKTTIKKDIKDIDKDIFKKGTTRTKVEIKADKTKKLPKIDTEKEVKKPKRTEGELAQIRGIIKDLENRQDKFRQDVKDGLMTKKQYLKRIEKIEEQIDNITKKLNKGGKI